MTGKEVEHSCFPGPVGTDKRRFLSGRSGNQCLPKPSARQSCEEFRRLLDRFRRQNCSPSFKFFPASLCQMLLNFRRIFSIGGDVVCGPRIPWGRNASLNQNSPVMSSLSRLERSSSGITVRIDAPKAPHMCRAAKTTMHKCSMDFMKSKVWTGETI